MSFCPKCVYLLDLTNNIPQDKLSLSEIKVIGIPKFVSMITNKKNIEDIDEIVLDFDLTNLKNSNIYKKLIKEDKIKAIDFFKKLKDDVTTIGTYYICNNCGFFKPIKSGDLLFNKNYDTTEIVETIDYELICEDLTLPRTKDYICKNEKCITHDKKNYNIKEAIWFRHTGTYQLTYVCCVCKTGWLI